MEGVTTIFNGTERYADMLLRRNRNVLAAEIIIIYQGFLSAFFLRQLESFYRSCSVHVM